MQIHTHTNTHIYLYMHTHISTFNATYLDKKLADDKSQCTYQGKFSKMHNLSNMEKNVDMIQTQITCW